MDYEIVTFWLFGSARTIFIVLKIHSIYCIWKSREMLVPTKPSICNSNVKKCADVWIRSSETSMLQNIQTLLNKCLGKS